MIQLPTKTQLAALKAWREPDCVTIYSPYVAANSSGKNPNQAQLKILLNEAKKYYKTNTSISIKLIMS